MTGGPHISVSGLTMAYGEYVVQRDLDFEINRGDVFIIMGGSGFGGFNFYGLDYISLRGYPDNSIGVREGGGNIYNKYSLELRYPISLNQAAPIWVLAYGEAGNVWDGFDNYDPFDLKRSAGVGIRVVLPMVGLLGVDWAWGFDNANDLNPVRSGSQFHFVIGQEF